MRRSTVRPGRMIARYAGPCAGSLFVVMVAGSTGFVLVAAYLMANPWTGPS